MKLTPLFLLTFLIFGCSEAPSPTVILSDEQFKEIQSRLEELENLNKDLLEKSKTIKNSRAEVDEILEYHKSMLKKQELEQIAILKQLDDFWSAEALRDPVNPESILKQLQQLVDRVKELEKENAELRQ